MRTPLVLSSYPLCARSQVTVRWDTGTLRVHFLSSKYTWRTLVRSRRSCPWAFRSPWRASWQEGRQTSTFYAALRSTSNKKRTHCPGPALRRKLVLRSISSSESRMMSGSQQTSLGTNSAISRSSCSCWSRNRSAQTSFGLCWHLA